MADKTLVCKIEVEDDNPRFTLTGCPDINSSLFQGFRELLRTFGGKAFTGRKWSRSLRVLSHVLQTLHATGWEVVDQDGSLEVWAEARCQEMRILVGEAKQNIVDASLILNEECGGQVMPYQVQDVKAMLSLQRGINANPPGLGKSLECMMAAPKSAPILVVAPNSALGVWQDHRRRFQGLPTTFIRSRKQARFPEGGEMVAMSYGMLDGFLKGTLRPDTWIFFDEFHAGRIATSKRSKHMRSLVEEGFRQGCRIWGLTGTPIMNREQDLWSLTQLLGLDYAWAVTGSQKDLWAGFVEIMGGKENKIYVPATVIKHGPRSGQRVPARTIEQWEFNVRRRCASLGNRLQMIAIRNSKKLVLDQLQPIRRQTVPCTLRDLLDKRKGLPEVGKDAEEILDRTWAQVEHLSDDNLLKELDRNPAFEEYAAFQRILAELKIPLLLELVEELEEADESCVVFCRHTAPVLALGLRTGWGVIHGGISDTQRTSTVQAFQEGQLKGIALTIGSGAIAITLTRAERAIFVDRDDQPPLNQQAEERLHRMGQQGSVLITDILLDHPLERRKLEAQRRKLRSINHVTEAMEVK